MQHLPVLVEDGTEVDIKSYKYMREWAFFGLPFERINMRRGKKEKKCELEFLQPLIKLNDSLKLL
jgi:hypothetical protein